MRCNEDEYLQPMTTTPPTNHAAYANADHSDNRDEHDDHQDHLIMILILMLMWILFLILMFYWCWCSVFHASFIMYFFFTIAISWIIIFYITTFHALFFTIHYVCNIFFDNHSMIMIIVIIIFSSCFCLLWFFCVIILQIVSSSSSALMSPFSLGNIYRMKRKMVWLPPHTHILMLNLPWPYLDRIFSFIRLSGGKQKILGARNLLWSYSRKALSVDLFFFFTF